MKKEHFLVSLLKTAWKLLNKISAWICLFSILLPFNILIYERFNGTEFYSELYFYIKLFEYTILPIVQIYLK